MTREEINNIRKGDIVTVRFAVNGDISCWIRGESVSFGPRLIPYPDVLSVERKTFQSGDLVKGPGFSRGVLMAEFKDNVTNRQMATVHSNVYGGYLTIAKDLIEFF